MYVFHRPGADQQAVLVFEVAAESRPLDHVMHQRHIFRVHPGSNEFESYGRALIKLKDAIELL